MAEFIVTVKNSQGKRIQVQRAASGRVELMEKLQQEGLFVIKITEGKGERFGERQKAKLGRALIGGKKKGVRVKGDRLVFFTRQLATMVAAGLPIVKILRGLASEEKPDFRKVLHQVSDDVKHGSTFSDALRRHPRVFDRLFTALVTSGEESGQLDVILDQLADYLETMSEIRMKVKSALRYPIFVLSFISVIIVVFFLKIIPKFAKIYESFDAPLPLPTQVILSLSALIRHNLLLTFLVVGLIIVGIKLIVRTEKGGYLWDQLKLNIPVFGKLMRRSVVGRLSRTLSVLSSSGMPIVQAMSVVYRVANNRVYERGLMDAKRRLEQGQPLAAALDQTGLMPELVIQMVTTGEETGTLDKMFAKVAEFYEKQVKSSVDGIVSLIEPAAIVALGVTVGGIILVMYLPIFKLGMVLR